MDSLCAICGNVIDRENPFSTDNICGRVSCSRKFARRDHVTGGPASFVKLTKRGKSVLPTIRHFKRRDGLHRIAVQHLLKNSEASAQEAARIFTELERDMLGLAMDKVEFTENRRVLEQWLHDARNDYHRIKDGHDINDWPLHEIYLRVARAKFTCAFRSRSVWRKQESTVIS